MAKRTKKNSDEIQAYKAFDENMECRGFQYEISKTYVHDGDIELCKSGFHACETPFDCWAYYPPSYARYSSVTLGRVSGARGDDSKLVAGRITLEVELSLSEFIARSVNYILKKAESKKSNTGSRSASTNTGYQSASTNTGYQSASTNTGYRSASTNTGDQSASTNTGDQSSSTNTGSRSASTNTGDRSASTNTGQWSASTNTGDRSASTNTGYRSASTNTGYRSASTNTGDQSASTNTGDRSASSVGGIGSVAMSIGTQGKAKAALGSAIVLVERSESGEIVHIFSRIAKTRGKVKPDIWYTLEGGNLVEVTL